MVKYHWGVDSTKNVTDELYETVVKNYGKPKFWGRYLTKVQGVCEGLTRNEIEFLHQNETKLLPIYNDFHSATGENEGRVAGMYACYYAKRLGIQKGTPIFVNVERLSDIDSSWIKGYVRYLDDSDFPPGFYFDPTEGNFSNAFALLNSNITDLAILWSTKPHHGITKEKFAPKFKPATVPCEANIRAWQYGKDSTICPIDTNIIDNRLFDMLY